MPKKEPLLIIFTDLDNTFTPITFDGVKRLVELVDEIQKKESVKVKFSAVSGRPADYVAGIMNMLRFSFESAGLQGVVDWGAGEQGGVIVHCKDTFRQKYIGRKDTKDVRGKVLEVLKNSKYRKILADDPGKRYTCSIGIMPEYAEKMSQKEKDEVFANFAKEVENALPGMTSIENSNGTAEITPKGVSKGKAVKYLLEHYSKSYDIRGITYSGDAENDITAVKYFSNLMEIKGVKANVFLPGNAHNSIHSEKLEAWKNKLPSGMSVNRIIKSKRPYFEGVLDEIEKSLKDGKLVEKKRDLKVKDDLDVYMENKKLANKTINKLERFASKKKVDRKMEM